ncbi:hypothetical protein L289_2852 [Acinetobacter gerneri DSM 14967 = CIP 107464 = MTCC 9824]|nr:hypothetical protein L289_2852 [Acinetobacter gerneri DSM 14967 = CIP 107464 = MTCC 9824]
MNKKFCKHRIAPHLKKYKYFNLKDLSKNKISKIYSGLHFEKLQHFYAIISIQLS